MADHVRDLATAIIAAGARHARAVAAAQARDQLASKLTSRLRVDGVVAWRRPWRQTWAEREA
jgi:hypothetical protein